ncbi:MAG: DUF59 domain-containing protein [Bacteroidia bacterium]|nr:DUF59 domain-containing protein [Bacteroidia bacterium]
MDNLLKEKVENAIESVMYPSIDLSFTTLGIVKDVKIRDEKV